MTIQPAYSYLLIQVEDQRELEGQLVLPEGAKPLLPYGKVLAIGPDCKVCQPGDKVIFQFNLAQGLNQEDKTLLIQESLISAFYIDDVSLTS